ncbi:MAG: metallophosphoesterase [Opitutales bacterium]
MSATLIIGDVHGCFDELARLLDILKPAQDDRLIQLGDLINKGPDSPGCVALARQTGMTCLIGNHEDRLLQARQARTPLQQLKRDDAATLTAIEDPADWDWLATLPDQLPLPELETVCVHGGFLPGDPRPWQDQPRSITSQIQVIAPGNRPGKRSDWPDSPLWADFWTGPPRVLYGHTPRPEPYLSPWALGIDTGCVYGGRLTAWVFPENRPVSVRARRAYSAGSADFYEG